jgi:type I restriction enzyme, S subunit
MMKANDTDKSNWQTVRFGDVAREVKDTEQDPLAKGITRYVGLADLDPDSIQLKRWSEIADSETTFTRLFRKGQMLFGRRRAYQHKAAVAPFDGICSGDIIVMEAKPDKLLPELLPFLIHRDGFFDYAIQTSAGSLSPRTKWSHLAKYEFALPPLDEQRRIAEVLTAVEDELKSLESVTHALQQVKFSLGVKWFKKSETIKLGELVEQEKLSFQTGPFGTVLKASSYTEVGTPIVNPVNMKNGKLNTDDGPFLGEEVCQQLSKYRAEHGDTILGRKGEVGRAIYISDEYHGYIIGSDIIRVRPCNPDISSKYLYYFFESEQTKSYLMRHASGTTMPGINERILSQLPLPLPDLRVQESIVAELERLDEADSSVNSKQLKALELKRGILNTLLSK